MRIPRPKPTHTIDDGYTTKPRRFRACVCDLCGGQLYRACNETIRDKSLKRAAFLCEDHYAEFAAQRPIRWAEQDAAIPPPTKTESNENSPAILPSQRPTAVPGEPGQQHVARRRQGAVAVAA